MKQNSTNDFDDIKQSELIEAADGIDFSVDDGILPEELDEQLLKEAQSQGIISDTAANSKNSKSRKKGKKAKIRRNSGSKNTSSDEMPERYERKLSRKVKRKFKKGARSILRLTVIAVIVALISLLYIYRDDISISHMTRWISENVLNSSTSEFPVAISGSKVELMEAMKDNVAVITDTSLMIVKDNGRFAVNRQHNLDNPSMHSSLKTTMTYEIGSGAIYIDNRNSNRSKLNTENNILAADMNSSGYYAYATRSGSGYMSEFYVYNSSDQLIFKSKQSKYLITDLSISADSKTVAVLMIGVEDGDYVSVIKLFDLKSETPAETKIDNILLLKLCNTGECIYAISQDTLYQYDSELKYEDRLDFDKSISTFSFENGGETVIVFDKEQITDDSIIYVIDGNCEVSIELAFPEKISDLKRHGKYLYVLTPDTLYRYDENGEYQNEWNMQGNAKRFAVNDRYAYVADGSYIYRFNVK